MSTPFVSGPPGTASFTYFDGAASRLLKTGPGSLRAVIVGVPSVSGEVTLYDGLDTSGKVIAVLDATEGRNVDFSCAFFTGLYVVVAGATNTTISFF
ncbi:hypothetical protein NE850_23125 [Paraburkholderia sp. USG1]|uniref:hypothetical protein n=1 Tax=Paraburkholderia sp. USG1 TaxID=2952268 RepID=UPI00285F925E|nr:hypothetical protein [Paraburkholderia sp. USG1]MDR8399218.1 hypothetical protein [Paraburkholderia sp. USG1]